MNSRQIIIGLSLLIGGCAFEIDTAMDMDFEPGELDGITWIKQSSNSPTGDAEALAAQVLKHSGKRQNSGNLSAWLMQEDPPFATVAVDKKSSGGDEMTARTLYRFNEDTIIASSYPEFLDIASDEENKPQRERYARETAMQAFAGNAPARPILYEGKYAYSSKFDGGCRVIVTELNTHRKIIGKYDINVCPN